MNVYRRYYSQHDHADGNQGIRPDQGRGQEHTYIYSQLLADGHEGKVAISYLLTFAGSSFYPLAPYGGLEYRIMNSQVEVSEGGK